MELQSVIQLYQNQPIIPSHQVLRDAAIFFKDYLDLPAYLHFEVRPPGDNFADTFNNLPEPRLSAIYVVLKKVHHFSHHVLVVII